MEFWRKIRTVPFPRGYVNTDLIPKIPEIKQSQPDQNLMGEELEHIPIFLK